MKVAVVSPYDLSVPGGVQDQAVRLTRWLAELGHDPLLVGPGVTGPEGAKLLGDTIRVPANRSSMPITLDPRVISEVRESVAGVDVVHIHEPLMPIVSVAATAIGDTPTVGTFHADPPGWVRLGYRAGSLLWRQAIRRLNVVTTVSQVSGTAIAPFAQARVIANGIDVDDYGHERKVANRVTFLGRDDTRKGLQVLLDGWPAVVAQVPDAELHVIGARRDEKITGVRFLGRVDERTKLAELGRSEVYCAPNLGGESFGIVVAEGMASGCAVVASAIPAFTSVLGDAGCFVSPGDSEGLGERIVALLIDREDLRAKQRRAVVAVRRFDGSSIAAQYVQAYEDAIAGHRS